MCIYVPFKYSMYFCVSFIKVVWSGRDVCESFIYVSFIDSFIVSFIGSFTVGIGVVRLGEMRGDILGLRVMGDSDKL